MRARQGVAAIVVLCAALIGAGIAHGAGEPAFGCKKVHTGKADFDPNPKGRAPVALGDSTMLLPIPNLNAVGYTVNARGCRGFKEAVNIARKMKAKRHLPHLVLINSYGNGGVNPRLIKQALGVLGKKRVLGLVTAYNADTGHPPAPDTGLLFKSARRYPHRIFVMDWVKYSLPHHAVEPTPGAWFISDLFHPNFTGAEAYAQFLAQALPLARNGRFP
ncbi:MAG TPA: hypothetical protein VH501_02350 [Solirubrobacterales bacterium]|jgi:hypothetical protein